MGAGLSPDLLDRLPATVEERGTQWISAACTVQKHSNTHVTQTQDQQLDHRD